MRSQGAGRNKNIRNQRMNLTLRWVKRWSDCRAGRQLQPFSEHGLAVLLEPADFAFGLRHIGDAFLPFQLVLLEQREVVGHAQELGLHGLVFIGTDKLFGRCWRKDHRHRRVIHGMSPIPSRIRLLALMAALLACALPFGAAAAGDAVVFLEAEQFADRAAGISTSNPWTRWARPICWRTVWACR